MRHTGYTEFPYLGKNPTAPTVLSILTANNKLDQFYELEKIEIIPFDFPVK